MKKLFPLIKDRLVLFLVGIVAGILAGMSTSYVISLIKKGLASVDQIDQSFILQIIGLSLLAAIFGIASGYFMARVTAIVVRTLTQSLSEKILKANYEFVESNSERIVPVLTRDITVLSEYINRFPQFIISSTTVIVTIGVLLTTDWKLTSFFILAFALQSMLVAITLPLVRRLTKNATHYHNHLYRDLANLVSGLKELSLNQDRRSKYITEVVSSNVNNWNNATIRSKVLYETTDRTSDLLVFILSGLLMFLGATVLPVNFDSFKVILPTILFLLPFTIKIAGYFRYRSTAMVSLSQIHKLGIEISDERIDSCEDIKATNDPQNSFLRMKEVKFQYQNSKHETPISFGPVNIEFKKNNITFIIGGNGSGKTTFTKILTGLYRPTDGELIFNNQVVSNANLLSYRNQFSSYFTDSHVFEYLTHITDSFLETHSNKFISMLQMQHKVSIHEKQFNTTKLSYGQKSRLGLIANLLDDKEIYVFDEWAANQDPHYKEVFYYDILPHLKRQGKTVIVISHDEKYFDVADEIIELQEGMVVKNQLLNHEIFTEV